MVKLVANKTLKEGSEEPYINLKMTVPSDVARALGWEAGDDLLPTANLDTMRMVVSKIKKKTGATCARSTGYSTAKADST